MNDPTLIADLVRAGLDPELVGRVSNALVNVRDNVRDTAVREYETSRKRQWRKTVVPQPLSTPAKANDVAGSNAENVPQSVPDKAANAPTLLPFLSLNLEGTTEEGSKQESKSTENARARGQRMVAGAVLTDECRAAAVELGADPARIESMWAEFVDYWVAVPGQRGVKLDWLATWRNDVRHKLERGPRNGRAKQQSLSDTAFDLAEQARSRERAAGLI